MKYFELQIPRYRNDGKGYLAQHVKFAQWLLQYAGGYSKGPDVHGAWRDDSGKVYAETMKPYRVACDAAAFEKILSAAFDLFDDQHAIFYAELGEATIRNRDLYADVAKSFEKMQAAE